MIELRDDQLFFQFPEVHAQARLGVGFQRTLRIPDDGSSYPLPPGLGLFPIAHVDDHPETVPESWLRHGGVMLPMYQSEAMWLSFSGHYPMAVKVATGKICAVTGAAWREGLHAAPQDYLTPPRQPWLDGYCVDKGEIRQFVAMPLGAGYTAEEQITGAGDVGGIQLIAYPMRAEVWERIRPKTHVRARFASPTLTMSQLSASPEMGLAPGGRMRQEIYDDPYGPDVWDTEHSSRCFVHIANSLAWRAITGKNPPPTPATAKRYSQMGLPWFEYYSDGDTAVEGSGVLAKLKSVVGIGAEKGDVPLPENESATPEKVIHLRAGLQKDQVREGRF